MVNIIIGFDTIKQKRVREIIGRRRRRRRRGRRIGRGIGEEEGGGGGNRGWSIWSRGQGSSQRIRRYGGSRRRGIRIGISVGVCIRGVGMEGEERIDRKEKK